ncbi:MAG: cbb3-type cytochrome oxidase assembly protein CcoS [Deltaproteobacteria bacterium]|nr:cbb3-type cytochrome oxidase assembly protein CcoS [Deltaproteobacteria bacterium]
MSSIFLLIPLAIGMLALAAYVFVWAVRNGQFEDLDSPASRILFDDEALHPSSRRERVAPAAEPAATSDERR